MVWPLRTALKTLLEGTLSGGAAALWPHQSFSQLPDLAVLRDLVEKVRAAVMGEAAIDEAFDVNRLCELGGFDVEEMVLHGAEGHLQALLCPKPADRFAVIVDPEPPGGWERVGPTIQPVLREHRMRFRICHEIAHSFFFARPGDRPKPLVGASAAQEHFCDQFASELLIPRHAVRSLPARAASVVEIHQRFHVSLEASARAFAETHADLAVVLYVGKRNRQAVQWSNCDDPPAHGIALKVGYSQAQLDERHQTILVGPASYPAESPSCSLATL